MESGGEPETDHPPQQREVEDRAAGAEMLFGGGAEESDEIDHRSDAGGQHGPPRRARGSEFGAAALAEDHDVVERQIEERDDRRDDEHDGGFAASRPEAGEGVVEQKEPRALAEYREVDDLLSGDLRSMMKDPEERFRPEDAAAEKKRAEERQPDAAPDRAADALAVLRALILGDEGPGVADGADEDAGDGEVGEPAGEGGGDRLLGMTREHQAVDEHVDRMTGVGKY